MRPPIDFILFKEQPHIHFVLHGRSCKASIVVSVNQSFPSIRIEALPGCIIFTHLGKMLVSVDQFLNAGESRPHNETIFSFFRHLEMAERQGFGGSQIFSTAVENNFKIPDIITNIEETVLSIWNLDYIEGNENLNRNEKELLRVFYEFNVLSFSEILAKTDLSEHDARLAIDKLIEEGFIKKIGQGKATN